MLCSRCKANPAQANHAYCRDCARDYMREWRKKNRAHVLNVQRRYAEANRAKLNARQRARRADPAKAETHSRGVRASERTNPKMKAAHRAVYSALRAGRLTRPARCQACGKRRKTHAHHADYGQPLIVTWLCSECHGKEHRG